MLTQESTQSINLTPEARTHIKSLSVWMRVAAIIKLVLTVIFAFIFLIAMVVGGSQVTEFTTLPVGGMVMGFLFFAFIFGGWFYLALLGLQAGTRFNAFAKNNSKGVLEEAFAKNHKLWVFAIAYILAFFALYFLVFISILGSLPGEFPFPGMEDNPFDF